MAIPLRPVRGGDSVLFGLAVRLRHLPPPADCASEPGCKRLSQTGTSSSLSADLGPSPCASTRSSSASQRSLPPAFAAARVQANSMAADSRKKPTHFDVSQKLVRHAASDVAGRLSSFPIELVQRFRRGCLFDSEMRFLISGWAAECWTRWPERWTTHSECVGPTGLSAENADCEP